MPIGTCPRLAPPNAVLTYLAARTQHVPLGAQVVVVPWRHRVRLAEELTTLDTLGGRALRPGRRAAPLAARRQLYRCMNTRQ